MICNWIFIKICFKGQPLIVCCTQVSPQLRELETNYFLPLRTFNFQSNANTVCCRSKGSFWIKKYIYLGVLNTKICIFFSKPSHQVWLPPIRAGPWYSPSFRVLLANSSWKRCFIFAFCCICKWSRRYSFSIRLWLVRVHGMSGILFLHNCICYCICICFCIQLYL